MRKLYISVPMRGRTNDQILHDIRKLREYAECVCGESFEVIPSYNPELYNSVCSTKNHSIYCLSKSIEKMADADVFVGLAWTPGYSGCEIELDIANRYGLQMIVITESTVEVMLPELSKAMNDAYTTVEKPILYINEKTASD